MAIQETLEPAVTAELSGPEAPGTSYGAVGTVNGTAKFVSSALVGILWSTVSPAVGFGLAAVLMAAGTFSLHRMRQRS
jgi:dipeptide/tripeptide permease